MFSRIVSDPAILNGNPIVQGTRLSVEFLLELLASGASREDIVSAYPQLSPWMSKKPFATRRTD